MAALPTIDEVRDWCGVSPQSLSNDQLQMIYDGEDSAQRSTCRVDDPGDRDPDLIEAFYRRVARAIAARGIPLGSPPGNEAFGISHMLPGKFAIFVGGFPIEYDGTIVGGLGVSGGNGEQDKAVGAAGLQAFADHVAANPPA